MRELTNNQWALMWEWVDDAWRALSMAKPYLETRLQAHPQSERLKLLLGLVDKSLGVDPAGNYKAKAGLIQGLFGGRLAGEE